MSREEQEQAFINLAKKLESLTGSRLWINESITNRGYDRHGTTNVASGFVLRQTNWRINGGRLMLSGTEDELYEISSQILNCQIGDWHSRDRSRRIVKHPYSQQSDKKKDKN